MVVHVGPTATQIAVLEGRTLIEHYVSRPADDATQIDGNIYLGRVQNVLPGMEAAFVDIGTRKTPSSTGATSATTTTRWTGPRPTMPNRPGDGWAVPPTTPA